MKPTHFFALLFTYLLLESCGQDHRFKLSVEAFQKELNEKFADPDSSPLSKEALKSFTGLPFFDPDEKFRVKARFERVTAPVAELPTTTGKIARYQPFGTLHFQIDEQDFELLIYRNIAFPTSTNTNETIPLFLPFTDMTNGDETYGGGRYIEMDMQEGTQWTLDFNIAYNPYCAYDESFSCPIPPAENHLQKAIRAGAKYNMNDY